MALLDNAWYVDYGNGSSTGYYAVPVFSVKTYVAGEIIRQLTAPAVGSERCFVCTTAGLSVAEPAWTNTRGALNTSTVPVFQECTGIAALNGDATNTPTWTAYRTATATATLGQVIKRDNGASYWICTIGGAMNALGNEPAWANDTAGTTRTDTSATWTCLGVVGNFTGWQAPHARLGSAFTATWGAAGNAFFVATEHAETQTTANTLTCPGTQANPCFVYCVTKTTVPPASANLSTGASITTTGTSSIGLRGSWYAEGITFNCATGSGAASIQLCSNLGDSFILKNGALNQVGTGSVHHLWGSSTTVRDNFILLNNTTISFGTTGQGIRLQTARAQWKNTPNAIAGATLPTVLFVNNATVTSGALLLEGVDLNVLGSGKTLFQASNTPYSVILKDCKLGASVTISDTPTSNGGLEVSVINSDSSGTNYRHEKYQYMGTQTVETTIVRTGGATNGTTPIAWKIVTTGNSKWVLPFDALPMAIWNDVITGNTTITVYGIWGGGAVPNKQDIWFEAEYLGDANSPQASIVTSGQADNLAVSAANASDGSTWGGSTTAFKMSVTFASPAQKGPVYIYVKAAKATSTFYIDPKPVLS